MITSTANHRIRTIRSLNRRKERDALGLAYVEGIRPVVAAIESGADLETLVVASDLLTSDRAYSVLSDIKQRANPPDQHLNIEHLEVSARVFRSISNRDGPQGIAAVVRQRWERLDDVHIKDKDCWVALVEIADPGNLGSILRSCDATGVTGVIILGASADPYDRTALRASSGTTFTCRLVRSSWDSFASWARYEDVTITGASGDAIQSYRGANYGSKSVLLMGSERKGLSQEQQEACAHLVSIPMLGKTDSLNLAVATTLILYEQLHQRKSSTAVLEELT